MEHDLNKSKVEYHSKPWLDLTFILTLSHGTQTKVLHLANDHDIQWKTDL